MSSARLRPPTTTGAAAARAFLLSLALQLTPALALAAVLQVGPGQSLATQVRAAHPGDTLNIASGRYPEHLLIDKPLRLQAQGQVLLDGGGQGDVIRVRAPDVQIVGLTIAGSGIDLGAQNAGVYVEPGSHRFVLQDCQLRDVLFGVWLEGSTDALIKRNRVTGKEALQSAARGNGVQVYNAKRAQLLDNDLSHTRDGFYVDISDGAIFRGNRMHQLRYGTHYMNTNDSVWEGNQSYGNRGGLALMMVRHLVVRNNLAWNNQDHGIMLRSIQDSLVEGNVVASNGRGFFIYDAEYNTVRDNLVVDNESGVHLAAGSRNNHFDGNDFIANQQQVMYVASSDVKWGETRGNYWSNYSGWDQDGDGRGDIPYQANDVVDRLAWQYPLAKLLLSSPALQALRFVARQFPVLRAPSVIDPHPRSRPARSDWRNWIGKHGN